MSKLKGLLVIFVMVCFGCNDDDAAIHQSVFISYANHSTEPGSFILITNQDGEVLGSKTGLSKSENIDIDRAENDIIDFTIGRLLGSNQGGISLVTYRNLSEDFVYDIGTSCYKVELERADRKLTIQNFDGELLNSPLNEINIAGNNLELSGTTINRDIAITFRDNQSGEIKSRLIRGDEWSENPDEIFTLVLDAQDFNKAKEKTISLNMHSNWRMNASVWTNGDREIILNSHFTELEEGRSVSIYLPDDLIYESVRMQLYSTNFNNGHFYNLNNKEEFPEKIDFVLNEYGYASLSNGEFEINNRTSFNQAYIEYQYTLNPYFSTWRVYQNSGNELKYTLPELPEQVLEFIGEHATTLETPFSIKANFYQISDFEESEQYFDNAWIRYNCHEYTSSFNSHPL